MYSSSRRASTRGRDHLSALVAATAARTAAGRLSRRQRRVVRLLRPAVRRLARPLRDERVEGNRGEETGFLREAMGAQGPANRPVHVDKAYAVTAVVQATEMMIAKP